MASKATMLRRERTGMQTVRDRASAINRESGGVGVMMYSGDDGWLWLSLVECGKSWNVGKGILGMNMAFCN